MIPVRLIVFFILMLSSAVQAQHQNRLAAQLDYDAKTLTVSQELVYFNQSNDTLNQIVLNDWNNAYSGKETPLAKRFSDEFIRAFHLAKDEDRGSTAIISIVDQNGLQLDWSRPGKQPDIVDVQLKNPIYPNSKFKITFTYTVKIPNDRFTRFGFDDKGSFYLKNWSLSPARFENHAFVKYSNENLDDIANAVCDIELTLRVPSGLRVTSDLYEGNKTTSGGIDEYYLIGKSRTDFSLIAEREISFDIYNNDIAQVHTNLKDNRTTDIQRALLVDKIVHFTADNLGRFPHGKIVVTQADYERNPVYGLNQLPAFISPFPDSFLFEIRFLKTYLNAYLKNTLKLDPRRDNWIYDAMQMYLMMKYIEENHPDEKMMGQLSQWGILKGHNLFNVDFNGQYSYLYLLLARRNQDQPIGDPKNTFIKFNEQISGKYKAGLSLHYLDEYLENDIVPVSLKTFFELNKTSLVTDRADLEAILESKTDKDISWFLNILVATRELIDYKFGSVEKQGDSIKVTVKNKTGTNVPVSLYGINNGNVVFKHWLENIERDSTFIINRSGAEKLVLNYNNEVPEFNRRNNWKSLNNFFPNNRPFKFTFFQDLEDPRYNQIFYVPSFTFNLYDGLSPGLRFHNKSFLEKPFIFDIEPTYSIKTGNLIGSLGFVYNQYIREQSLYNIRYVVSASTYHYAPDAQYTKFTPAIQFRIREEDYRKNKRQTIFLRQVLVNRESSIYTDMEAPTESYSVFNARYSKYESEITRHYNFFTDIQLAGNFGKLSGEIQFRRLFNDNRQINLRFFAGMFMYRSTDSDFFSFGLDRPTDYLFDYNFYGRSETTGLFSQQFIMAEGGFKSKLDTRYANQWMTTVNGSFNIWNWIEVYGDAGFLKNEYSNPEFVYDSGIRLNLLTDYFELYFPVYSSNGFELGQPNYDEKIRFVVTLSPGTLVGLFTRRWL